MQSDNIRKRKHNAETIVETSRENIQPTSKSAGWTLLVQVLITLLTLPFIYVAYVYIFVDDVIEPKAISIGTPLSLEGPLAANSLLARAQRLYEGQLRGPESIVLHEGVLYTGTADGKIIAIEKGQIREVAQFGTPPCGGPTENEEHCGRPLGLRFDRDGYLIVLDAYLGLYKLNVATGDFFQYMSSNLVIDGFRPRFLNDLDIAPDGSIYFTDSSVKWPRRHFPFSLCEAENTGRLLRYIPETNTTEVLLKDLYFPNGVQISRSKEFLVFAETLMSRIWKYYIKGPKKGEKELLIENLPGLPDNIRKAYKGGGYWVALPVCRTSKFSPVDFLLERPSLRGFIAKAFNLDIAIKFQPSCGFVIQFDDNGSIIRSLRDATGSVVQTISEVEDHEGTLYLGSFKEPYIGKLELKQLL